ncbi:acetylxylan esterase [Georgenia sp. 311]|uniref:Acetylxylan esterase n=1 Tax=Georgenia wutianyii TaxID=2585135 RepID=A0ABX5VIY6_9MICO|nr:MULTISPECIES: acetylxylan esterase [Georgenia]QDB78337.1 acetylxylan esterase [Georgenia wutianyii]TNC20028.1 acetylxylan esterase [Georgenia sp. 311]
MPLFDLDAARLPDYRPDVAEPADFDDFWARTLAETRAHDLAVEAVPVDAHLRLVDAFDLTFSGFGGHRVKAWYLRPAGTDEPLPAVVEYLGYGGGRGLPHSRLLWAAAGYAYVVMDTRGQGTTTTNGFGATPDPVGTGVAAPGTLTRGIEDPHEHYYRRVYTDGVRAVEAVRTLPGVDEGRVAVTGVSQGGAITTAVAGLVDVAAAMPDVPWLAHIRRGVEMAPEGPFEEVRTYLAAHRDRVEPAFRTLSYIDGVNHAKRATAPALYSVALMDTVCPPSTVYASANHYGGDVDVEVYPFNEHEGGTEFQRERQLTWLAERLAR